MVFNHPFSLTKYAKLLGGNMFIVGINGQGGFAAVTFFDDCFAVFTFCNSLSSCVFALGSGCFTVFAFSDNCFTMFVYRGGCFTMLTLSRDGCTFGGVFFCLRAMCAA